MNGPDQQPSLWQQRNSSQLFAELCNALYERELARLARQSILDIVALQKRIASLPYYIKRAAEQIAELYPPMDLDSQNGSWLAPQSAKSFSEKHQPQKTKEFYLTHAKRALVVPVLFSHYGVEQILLDTIDDIDLVNAQIHCNEHGWFSMSGESRADSKLLLKPTKATMVAACCGHQWTNQKRSHARPLSLREMLLACQINWNKLSQLTAVN